MGSHKIENIYDDISFTLNIYSPSKDDIDDNGVNMEFYNKINIK